MISKAQKSLLHLAKARLGMEDADYRAMLKRSAGVHSSANLDQGGFSAVMDEFERLGFRSTRGTITRTASRQNGNMATPAQIAKIRALWRTFTGRDDDLAMGRWLEKHMRVSHLRFLDRRCASTCVAILDKMVVWKRSRSHEGKLAGPQNAA